MNEEFVDVALTIGGIVGLVAGFVWPPAGLGGAVLGALGLGLAIWERIIKPTRNSSAHEIAPPSQERQLANGLLFFGKGLWLVLLAVWAPYFAVWFAGNFLR